MLRYAFVALGAIALLGLPLSGWLQTSAESRYQKVQWVQEGQPSGDVERVMVGPVPRIAGTGPDGSIYVDRRYRDETRPFALDRPIFLFARLGCLAALLTAIAGFFVHRNLQRLARIERGEAPL